MDIRINLDRLKKTFWNSPKSAVTRRGALAVPPSVDPILKLKIGLRTGLLTQDYLFAKTAQEMFLEEEKGKAKRSWQAPIQILSSTEACMTV